MPFQYRYPFSFFRETQKDFRQNALQWKWIMTLNVKKKIVVQRNGEQYSKTRILKWCECLWEEQNEMCSLHFQLFVVADIRISRSISIKKWRLLEFIDGNQHWFTRVMWQIDLGTHFKNAGSWCLRATTIAVLSVKNKTITMA